LGQLQSIAPQLVDLGYQIIAISPDRPEHLRESLEKNKLGYMLLSDTKLAAAQAFGIAYRVDDETFAKLKSFGLDIEAASGEKHHLLPVPSAFVVDGDGKISFAYVNPDYKTRVDPDVLLAAAKAALK
jgi:peroxiredoxin